MDVEKREEEEEEENNKRNLLHAEELTKPACDPSPLDTVTAEHENEEPLS